MTVGVTGAQSARAAPAAANIGPLVVLLCLYFVLEYVRPPLLAQLKLQMLIVLVLPLLCIMQLQDRKWSPILTAQVLLVLVNAAMVPFRWNNFSAYMVTRGLVAHVSIAVCLVWIVRNLQVFDRLMMFWMAIMLYVALFAITHGGTGPGGLLGDENDLALACVTSLPVAFFKFQHARGPEKPLWAGVGVTLVTATVVSFSRGGFVGLAAVTLYCLLVSRHKLRNLGLLLVSGLFFVLLAPDDYLAEVRSIQEEATGQKKGTGESRRFLWETAFNMWKAYPVAGVGGGNFNFQAGVYQPDWEGREYQERNWSGTTTHSAFFQLLSEQGGIGFGLWLFMVVTHLRILRGLRRRVRGASDLPERVCSNVDAYACALSAGMVGALAAGAFLSVGYYPYFYFYSALAAALRNIVPEEGGLPASSAEASGPGSQP